MENSVNLTPHEHLNEVIVQSLMLLSAEAGKVDGIDAGTDEDYLKGHLNVNLEELREIVWFVTEQVPSSVFLENNQHVRDYLHYFLSKELLQFLLIEEKTSNDFKLCLENFRDFTMADFLSNTYVDK